MSGPIRLATHIYSALLRLYPPHFQADFADEMRAVFLEGANDATTRGALGPFLLREMRDAPQALVTAYWSGWINKWHGWIKLIRQAASASDLPSPPPDGRTSWKQAGLELGLFLLAGLLLILVTYLPFEGLRPGWQRDLDVLGHAIVPITLPLFLVGLARGLPRWAYPSGGLLLSYFLLVANQSGLLPFLSAMLSTAILLAVLAIVTNSQPSPLPVPLRRIGQSLSLDWTRLSFAVYGAMPLAIIFAFDDAQTNIRTPYLAISVLAMVAGALIHCRSRYSTMQMTALLGGMSLSIWMALLDRASFAGGLAGWITAPRPGAADIAWMLDTWLLWAGLLLAPVLLAVVVRAASPRRAA